MFDWGGETTFGSSYWEVQKIEGSRNQDSTVVVLIMHTTCLRHYIHLPGFPLCISQKEWGIEHTRKDVCFDDYQQQLSAIYLPKVPFSWLFRYLYKGKAFEPLTFIFENISNWTPCPSANRLMTGSGSGSLDKNIKEITFKLMSKHTKKHRSVKMFHRPKDLHFTLREHNKMFPKFFTDTD